MKSRIQALALVALAAVALSLVALADESAAPSKPAATPATHHASSSSKSATSTPKVNLNSATKEELMKLPGITDEIADKIIAARPFKSRSELLDKKLVTHAEYEKVHNHLTVKSSGSTEAKKS